jgi:hypothetical protein
VEEGEAAFDKDTPRKESSVRAHLSLLMAVTGLVLAASQASAQCCYIAPPRAPDMLNPGFWYTNCFGVTYWPNYNVMPPFPPFQGMVMGPNQGGPSPRQIQGLGGFPQHLYARGPRDFFMYETDPRTSPYRYGFSAPGLPTVTPGGGIGGDRGLAGFAGE